MSEKEKIRTIAFDFDGVVSEYHGFAGLEHVGEPIAEAVATIRKLKELGHIIIIYSTRGDDLIKKYCNKHAIPVDYIRTYAVGAFLRCFARLLPRSRVYYSLVASLARA